MVYSHMKLTLQYFVFMLLRHIKGFTAKLDLCSYPVNLSQDEPGFRYVCNFLASLSFQISAHIWNLLLQSQLCLS